MLAYVNYFNVMGSFKVCMSFKATHMFTGGMRMITTEYISFSESLFSSLLGIAIVFLSLVFLALFVKIVSKVISALEKNLVSTAKVTPAPASAAPAAAHAEAVTVAVIAAAVSEERREPLDRFVITNIQKI